MEAAPKVQAKVFHHPAYQPHMRPYFGPAVMDAQWYTPAEDGIAEASSARQAEISQ